MAKFLVKILWFLALSMTTINAADKEYLMESNYLPDLTRMPILANGHLGYQLFRERIELNCVFNGKNTTSERARIPNWGNVKVNSILDDNQKDHLPGSKTTYKMDTRTGVFEWEIDVSKLNLKIVQRTYAHRFYNRGIVYELQVKRSKGQDAVKLHLKQSTGSSGDDMKFYIIANTDEWRIIKGITKSVEDEKFQKDVKSVFIVQSENVEKGKILELNPDQKELNYKFIVTLDESEEVAKMEAKKLMELNSKQIMDTHVKEWDSFWKSFNVKIDGNDELAQIVNAGIFYMASALPSLNSSQPNEEYCGLSPNGIGQGRNNYNTGLKGHTYWDTELLMLPVVTHFSNSWGRELWKYRETRLEAARINANRTGYKGARYPWRSAYTGLDMEYNIYVSAVIIAGAKKHFAVTNDKNWLCNNSWPMIQEISEYLASRVSWNATLNRYDIKDVLSPSRYDKTDNSVFVNAVYKIAFEFASDAQAICNIQNDANNIWKQIAEHLFIPYDPILDYHPESEKDYKLNANVDIKEPDVVLMGYPLEFEMNLSTRINDINIYEEKTTDEFSRTWPIFATNFLDIDVKKRADECFRKSYKNYVLNEFKIWTQTKFEENDNTNFHAGFSAFFQSIMNGYAGIRFYHAEDKSIMEFRKRHLLPDTKAFKIHGISFADSTFELNIKDPKKSKLSCIHLGNKTLELVVEGKKNKEIKQGFSIDLGTENIYIQTA